MSHYILNFYSRNSNILEILTYSVLGTSLSELICVTLEQKYKHFDLCSVVNIDCKYINNI